MLLALAAALCVLTSTPESDISAIISRATARRPHSTASVPPAFACVAHAKVTTDSLTVMGDSDGTCRRADGAAVHLPLSNGLYMGAVTAGGYVIEPLFGRLARAVARDDQRCRIGGPSEPACSGARALLFEAADAVPFGTVAKLLYSAGQAEIGHFVALVGDAADAAPLQVFAPTVSGQRPPPRPCARLVVYAGLIEDSWAVLADDESTMLAGVGLRASPLATIVPPTSAPGGFSLVDAYGRIAETLPPRELCAFAVVTSPEDAPWSTVVRAATEVGAAFNVLIAPATSKLLDVLGHQS